MVMDVFIAFSFGLILFFGLRFQFLVGAFASRRSIRPPQLVHNQINQRQHEPE